MVITLLVGTHVKARNFKFIKKQELMRFLWNRNWMWRSIAALPAQALKASSCRHKSDETSLLYFFVSFGRPFVQVLSSSWDGRPFGHNRHRPKIGGGCTPLEVGDLSPYVTQCGLGRGLPLHQVAPWSIQSFGHNRHGPKIGGGALCPPFWEGVAGSRSSTMWSGPRPTSILSGILESWSI